MVWLTQRAMAELFQTTVPNINMHIRNIFEEGEIYLHERLVLLLRGIHDAAQFAASSLSQISYCPFTYCVSSFYKVCHLLVTAQIFPGQAAALKQQIFKKYRVIHIDTRGFFGYGVYVGQVFF